MQIVLLDSFYTGSHKQWAINLKQNSKHQITIFSMKGIHWKWRMHGGAITLSQQLNESKIIPDLILVTDMIDVGIFKSLLNSKLKNIPIILYFHENQLMYPKSNLDSDITKNRDNHYGFINFTSALIANKVIFNSKFHQNGFLKALQNFLKKFPDYSLIENIKQIEKKSTILPIGIHMDKSLKIDSLKHPQTILWNHRWEHDKNPDLFFKILFQLKNEKIPFKLNVVGENFKNSPQIFKTAQNELNERILNWGYLNSREDYFKTLNQSDILPVTSIHDFFGISTVKAMGYNVFPLLPNRLAYPEHIPPKLKTKCIYESDEDLYLKLKKYLENGIPDNFSEIQNHIFKYEMSSVIKNYDELFEKSI